MPDPTTAEELDLSHYVDVILRRRWIVISGFTIVFLSTLLYTFTTRPVFQSSTMLVIEKERGGSAVSADGSIIESNNDDYYQTQYKLFKSQSLLQQVYDKLDLAKTEDFAQPHGLQKLDRAFTIAPVLRNRLVYVKAELALHANMAPLETL